MTHFNLAMRFTLYPASLLTVACVIVLHSPTMASAEIPIAPTQSVDALTETNSAIAPPESADVSDAAFPQPTVRSVPQIEFGAPLDSSEWDTPQPQPIQSEAIAPPQVIDQPQFSSYSDSLASVPTAPTSIELTSQAEPAPLPSTDPQPTEPAGTQPAERERFGTTGQRYWYVQGGSAISFDNDDDGFAGMGLAGVGLTEFVGNGHSINAELNGLGFLQPGTDALGINLTVLSRWHFLRQEDWSLYVDGGAGVMATTSEVPATGSQINFTPQAGIGATFRMRDEDQLMVGLRWHHISNGNLYESNPGRDSILLYLGLSQRR